jgi:hypothetical protein
MPITEYLHESDPLHITYGEVKDPSPDKGREMAKRTDLLKDPKNASK